MSYDLALHDPVNGCILELDYLHDMRGGTYAVGGSALAELNITWNYANHYYRVFGEQGLRTIYGKTGAESIPILQDAISQLADDATDNYWDGTEGNAKRALCQCLAFAQIRPDGIWNGD